MDKPNVLLITTDEQRWDAVGFSGNPHVRTPNLDRLAEDSVVLSNHTCSSPICTPARASILTGLYPYRHGAWHVGYKLDESQTTLADVLGEAGYRCGFVGKAHFEAEKSGYVHDLSDRASYYGFAETHITEDMPDGEYVRWIEREHPEYLDVYLRACHEDVQAPRVPMASRGTIDAVYTSPVPEHLHQTAWITDRTIELTEKSGSDPFLIWCSYVDPHHPWNPPEPFASVYDPNDLPAPAIREGETDGLSACYFFAEGLDAREYRRMCAAYYALISHIDHHVGRLIAHLKERGLYDNTIIVFTSDHGDFNGDHGLIRKNAWLYDSLLRVPMSVKLATTGSDETPSTAIFEGLSQHEDILPTIVDLVGLEPPRSVDGISLAEALRTGAAGPRDVAHFEYMNIHGARIGDHKLIHYPRHLWDRMLQAFGAQAGVEHRGSLLRYPDESEGFVLTDVDADPLEYTNLSGRADVAEVERRLREEICDFLLRTPRYFPPKQFAW